MKNKLKILLILSAIFLGSGLINSCKKEKQTSGTDKELYDMARSANGFTWYKNSNTLLSKSPGSGHPQPFLKTRYNSIAATQLDSTGKIVINATFPEGSLIVKELFKNSNTLDRYAILYKQSGSADADSKGWIWGYIDSDGDVAEPASDKGSSCNSCHSQTDNIDYMLMNKYFP